MTVSEDSSQIEKRANSSIDQGANGDEIEEIPARLCEKMSAGSFESWYRKREYTKNIRQGTHYFNGPGKETSPERHSPSQLLQCQRKIAYRQQNAPEETSDPEGIFWIGSQFETEIAVPFLRDAVTGENEYVTNSIWIDFSVDTEAGELRIKGETDPVIVDVDAIPLVLTEIKTKQSVEELKAPNRHHRAQAHAYMKGLSEKHDRTVTDAIILYAGRTNLDIRSFHVEFDPYFWREVVLSWAAEHTEYRLRNELPPATPEYDWECQFCSYNERCGKGDTAFSDIGPTGLLPGVATYPKQKLVDYLDAHDNIALTPTLAHKFPELVDEYQVLDWHCRVCDATYRWDGIDWNSDAKDYPRCPDCADSEPIGMLGGPPPADQLRGEDHGSE
jgi:CRISPR-associated exonuclease Cas4